MAQLPKEVVGSPSLGVFQKWEDEALRDMGNLNNYMILKTISGTM